MFDLKNYWTVLLGFSRGKESERNIICMAWCFLKLTSTDFKPIHAANCSTVQHHLSDLLCPCVGWHFSVPTISSIHVVEQDAATTWRLSFAVVGSCLRDGSRMTWCWWSSQPLQAVTDDVLVARQRQWRVPSEGLLTNYSQMMNAEWCQGETARRLWKISARHQSRHFDNQTWWSITSFFQTN